MSSHIWSSNGKYVMSILQPLRRIVGANQVLPPSEVKMTLVLNRYRVPLGSNSSALTKNDPQINMSNILRDARHEYFFFFLSGILLSGLMACSNRIYIISGSICLGEGCQRKYAEENRHFMFSSWRNFVACSLRCPKPFDNWLKQQRGKR